MFHFKSSIRLKLLVPVTATLIVCLSGLAVFILSTQNRLNGNMEKAVGVSLQEENAAVVNSLGKLNQDITVNLGEMAASVSDIVGSSTKSSLEKEKTIIERQFNTLIQQNADGMAQLLAQVSANAILTKEFSELINYARAANKNPNVVFTIFFDASGTALTRYLNRKHEKIMQYLEAGGNNKVDTVLQAARQDDNVFLVEQQVLSDGEQIGRVVLCIDKTKAMQNIKALAQRFENLIAANNTALTKTLTKESGDITSGIEKAVGFVVEGNKESTAKTRTTIFESSNAMVNKTRSIIIAGGFLCILIVCCLLYLNIRAIVSPLDRTVLMIREMARGHLDSRLSMQRSDEIGQMADSMDSLVETLQHDVQGAIQKLAAGDMRFNITPKDEDDAIGNALQQAGNDLNELIGGLQIAAAQIARGAFQVSEGSQSLSQGATQQASSLEEISSSMAEISSQTKTNAENANLGNQLVNQVKDAANKGNNQMQAMVDSMAEINEAGQNISKIIKVIDEIAFQTNLLALNAAVEAARAGKHGKGFAVVAEEVRNLAARSAKAAQETAELIEGSVQKTVNGTEIANQTSLALQEIVNGVTKVTDLVGEIAAASNEQSHGIAQVNTGLDQIDKVTQQNTANSEESAAAAEELSKQAAQLRSKLSHFVLKNQHAEIDKMALKPKPPRETGPENVIIPEDIIALKRGQKGVKSAVAF